MIKKPSPSVEVSISPCTTLMITSEVPMRSPETIAGKPAASLSAENLHAVGADGARHLGVARIYRADAKERCECDREEAATAA